jgi:hypothetical protein
MLEEEEALPPRDLMPRTAYRRKDSVSTAVPLTQWLDHLGAWLATINLETTDYMISKEERYLHFKSGTRGPSPASTG